MQKPTLQGQRVVLRPISVADAPAMLAGTQDAEVARLTGSQPSSFTLAQIEAWCARLAEADDRYDFAITRRDDPESRYLGEVVLNNLDEDNGCCGFRIWLVSACFGQGLGTEATELALAFAFDTLKLHRVELEVYAFNPRARHVYEKCGFVAEGVRRDALRWEGSHVDAIGMAMLADEWVARQAARTSA